MAIICFDRRNSFQDIFNGTENKERPNQVWKWRIGVKRKKNLQKQYEIVIQVA